VKGVGQQNAAVEAPATEESAAPESKRRLSIDDEQPSSKKVKVKEDGPAHRYISNDVAYDLATENMPASWHPIFQNFQRSTKFVISLKTYTSNGRVNG